MDNILIYTFFLLLFVVILYDVKTKSIPNIISFVLILFSMYLRVKDLNSWFIGASTYILPFVFIYGYVSDILEREVLGFGDIKLTIALGGLLYNKTESLFLSIYTFYLIAFISAATFLLLIYILKFLKIKKEKTKKTTINYQISFSVFLIFSFLVNYYFYTEIISLVLKYV